MSSLIDLTGKRFGRLTVVGRAADYIKPSGKRCAMWHCVCDCGKEKDILGENLKKGATRSCGCFRSDENTRQNSTHHLSTSPLYAVWCAMKARCNNPNATYFKHYGGRGIKVCDSWMNSFESFRDWAMSSGYNENAGRGECTLDRIDNNGNYEPENCRWITSVAQANNRRSNRVFSYNGEEHNITEWAGIMGLNPKTLFNRIYSGWDFKRAITTKINNK